ncbi:MAG TPA: type I-E CRISPR-associated protein Cse2/CasB [Candidatus Aveggerthella stercoripullorum]|uniref:Type I-E CRISPR-associated protein Cse2/CasB n=1 Tax=Candidatus Aveggerthella stercoripullorum TaxID=2840688 RepID=A0A9D1D3P8_9ACTN|nr:type I-E CRISPR-associated protein Cse2/CasB [Candidatus Aveggerthella stercoripullorum]
MSRSIFQEADAIAGFVVRKIRRLQDGSSFKAPTSSSSRASLARLRRLGTPGSAWMAVGSDLFEGWPELSLSARDEKRMANAIVGALRLYAYHQQSKQVSMAWTADDSAMGEDSVAPRHRSFGWSCWALEPDREKSQGVRRRMASIEAASDFAGIEHNLRALVTLMRSKDVKVDYWSLTRDLYLVQFDGTHDAVFMRWARDYYAPKQAGEDSALIDGVRGVVETEGDLAQ